MVAVIVGVGLTLVFRNGTPPDARAARGPADSTTTPPTPSDGQAAPLVNARSAVSPPPKTTSTVDSAAASPTLAQVANLGIKTAGSVPTQTSSVIVVSGDGPTLSTATISLYIRDSRGWRAVNSWRGHVGAKGWTTQHSEGDLRTPVGRYTLSDAGGRMTNPGTTLPYYQSAAFVPSQDEAFGDSLAGSFDYLVAINYNRQPGTSPADQVRPLGRAKGGGIWLHVDHDGPTHGCVSVPLPGMKTILKALSPNDFPVIVMADKARLAS